MSLIRAAAQLYEDVVCGVRSGVRPCCLLFYLTAWRATPHAFYMLARNAVEHARAGTFGIFVEQLPKLVVDIVRFRASVALTIDGMKHWGYIACPICVLLREPETMKRCSRPEREKRLCDACGFACSLRGYPDVAPWSH